MDGKIVVFSTGSPNESSSNMTLFSLRVIKTVLCTALLFQSLGIVGEGQQINRFPIDI